MTKTTQCAKILRELRKGRSLTMLDIYKCSGSMNGHKRIYECSYLVWPDEEIKPDWKYVKGRKLRCWRLA